MGFPAKTGQPMIILILFRPGFLRYLSPTLYTPSPANAAESA